MVVSVLFLREHEQFVRLCLKLLCAHLSLATTGTSPISSVLGNEATKLRHLLFRYFKTFSRKV